MPGEARTSQSSRQGYTTPAARDFPSQNDLPGVAIHLIEPAVISGPLCDGGTGNMPDQIKLTGYDLSKDIFLNARGVPWKER